MSRPRKTKYEAIQEMIDAVKAGVMDNHSPSPETLREADVLCKALEMHKDTFSTIPLAVCADLLLVEMLYGQRQISCRDASRLESYKETLSDAIDHVTLEHAKSHADDLPPQIRRTILRMLGLDDES